MIGQKEWLAGADGISQDARDVGVRRFLGQGGQLLCIAAALERDLPGGVKDNRQLHHASRPQRLAVERIRRDRICVAGSGLVLEAIEQQGTAEVVMRIGEGGIAVQRGSKCLLGGLTMTLILQHQTEVVVAGGMVRPHGDGLPVVPLRFPKASQRHEKLSELVMAVSGIRPQHDGGLEQLDGAIAVTACRHRLGQIAGDFRRPGRKAAGLAQPDEGCWQVSPIAFQATEIVGDLGGIGPDRPCRFERGFSVHEAAQGHEHAGAGVMKRRTGGVDGDGGVRQFQRGQRFATVTCQQAQQVDRVGLVRIGRQNSPVRGLREGRFSGLMEPDSGV